MLSAEAIDQRREVPAERGLWIAVLRQAVSDLRYYRPSLRHFTRLWFESTSREPGSFEWICDQLELDALWLRRRLLEVSGKDSTRVARIRPMEREPEKGGDTSQNQLNQSRRATWDTIPSAVSEGC
jgi:hypothetical protein